MDADTDIIVHNLAEIKEEVQEKYDTKDLSIRNKKTVYVNI